VTAQAPDTMLFDDREYSITGVSGDGLFDPAIFVTELYPSNTACWRGYVAHYVVREGRLILDRLEASLAPDATGPEINGVKPSTPTIPFLFLSHVYDHLELKMDFSGKLVIGTDFIRELYVHMGWQPSWKYRTVLQLEFKRGELTLAKDLSDAMEKERELAVANNKPPDAVD
jgi:hypothetical protein